MCVCELAYLREAIGSLERPVPTPAQAARMKRLGVSPLWARNGNDALVFVGCVSPYGIELTNDCEPIRERDTS